MVMCSSLGTFVLTILIATVIGVVLTFAGYAWIQKKFSGRSSIIRGS